jgi:hypothetical protein
VGLRGSSTSTALRAEYEYEYEGRKAEAAREDTCATGETVRSGLAQGGETGGSAVEIRRRVLVLVLEPMEQLGG